jgi:transposase
MVQRTRYPTELRERAVRMVVEHRKEHPSEWAAICSIAEKCGVKPESLRLWLRRTEIDTGQRAGVTSEQQERIRELERANRELRRANEILKAAAAFFACMSA